MLILNGCGGGWGDLAPSRQPPVEKGRSEYDEEQTNRDPQSGSAEAGFTMVFPVAAAREKNNIKKFLYIPTSSVELVVYYTSRQLQVGAERQRNLR